MCVYEAARRRRMLPNRFFSESPMFLPVLLLRPIGALPSSHAED
jgi:hypothetical protein